MMYILPIFVDDFVKNKQTNKQTKNLVLGPCVSEHFV